MQPPPKPEVAKATPRPKWVAPHIKVQYGSYFKPDPEEQAKIVKMCADAMTANLAPLRSLVEKLAPVFGFDNIDMVVEAIEEAQEKADERELSKTAAEAEALHKLAGGADGSGGAKPKGGPAGGKNPPKAGRSGGFGAAPAKAKSKV